MTASTQNKNTADNRNNDLAHFERIKNGDVASFTTIFKSYYEQLYQFAGRYVHDAQLAEGIVQDVFIKIWSKRATIRIKSNGRAYLYRAVRNHCLNFLNQNNTSYYDIDDAGLDKSTVESPENAVIADETNIAIASAIEKLPEQCRTIFLLKREDGLTYPEIADLLNISVNTVKTQMKRALKSLRNSLAAFLSICSL